MQAQSVPLRPSVPLLLDPLALLTQQLKNKAIKKKSVEEIGTIALVLSPRQVRENLVPLLIKTFVQENTQMRVAIISSFKKVLPFIGSQASTFSIFEFVLDVLCVFGEDQLRKEAYQVLDVLINFIDLSSAQTEIRKVIEQLSKETDTNIRQLVLKLVRSIFVVADEKNEQFLMQVFQGYKESEDGQILLAEQLKQFIRITPPFPEEQIHSAITLILASSNVKAKSNLAESLLLLAQVSGKQKAQEYVLTLLKDSNSEVVASLIGKTKQIVKVFPEEIHIQLWAIVDAFESKDLTIKTAIIEVLEDIPLTPERKNMVLKSHNTNISLNLSKTLANSLCKIHDIEALKTMIESSDTQFKNKLFPKLPPTCGLHVQLMENLFAQKNWRNKLTLLQNIEKRLELGEDVQILVPKLLEQMGDKIAVFRSSVVKLIALILKTKKMKLKTFVGQLNSSLNSKNWFERQSVYILFGEISKQSGQLEREDMDIIAKAIRQGVRQKIDNIREVALTLKQACNLKSD